MCAVVRQEGIQSISAKGAFGSSFATSLHIAPHPGDGAEHMYVPCTFHTSASISHHARHAEDPYSCGSGMAMNPSVLSR